MIRYFTAHPTVANLLMLILIVMGLIALPSVKRETFPPFEADEIAITAIYPGASAEDVEEAVCQKIEDAIDGISDIEKVTSVCAEGSCSVTVEVMENGDLEKVLDDIKTEVDAITDFPDLVEDVNVSEKNRTDLVTAIAITGPMDNAALKAYCRTIKDELKLQPNVSYVEIGGFSEHLIKITLSKQTINSLGLSISDISSAIASQNLNMPSGTLEGGEREYLIRFLDERKEVEEYKEIVVFYGSNGAEIKLGDIAEITEQFENDDSRTELNGLRAGTISISKTKDQDTLTVFESVKKFIDEKQLAAPKGVTFTITRDMASIINDRLMMVTKNGIQGLILVFFVMWLFFSFRISFWVAVGLPVSFLGTLFVLPAIGFTINMMSLVGLMISIGILMDDAIVLTENIATFLRKGYNSFDATVKGINQVKIGVMYSFLTTVAVFIPLCFLSGRIGKVLYLIPVTLTIVLTFSLVEAFLILPHHIAHSMKNYDVRKKGAIRKAIERATDWVTEVIIGTIVDVAVKFRYLVVGSIVMLLIISLSLFTSGKVKFQGFPSAEGDTVECKIQLPQGTPNERTVEVVEQMVAALQVVRDKFDNIQPGGNKLVEDVTVSYGRNRDVNESGSHVATIYADLLGGETRVTTVEEVVSIWRKNAGEVPDALSISFGERTFGPGGRAFDVDITGTSLSEMKDVSLELQAWIASFEGTKNINDDLRFGKPEIKMSLKDGASSLGLTGSQIARQLRASFNGSKADEIQRNKETYSIEVWLADDDRNTLSDLEDTLIVTGSGALIPLRNLVDFEESVGYSKISRVNGQRKITVRGEVDSRIANSTEINDKMRLEFIPEMKRKYPNIQMNQGGEVEQNKKTFSSMLRAFLIGILCVFMMLSFQFRSYIEPLVVMFVIPFTLIGVIWGHYLMGITLCMPSLMGFVSLCGIVVNDSLLLVEFVKIRGRGLTVFHAAKQASRDRFRAVLITSATTVFGIMPMLFETSFQARMIVPLVASIAFGLTISTILVLFVVPCLYVILDDFGISTFGSKEEHAERIKNAVVAD